jgi:hypothetical protein
MLLNILNFAFSCRHRIGSQTTQRLASGKIFSRDGKGRLLSGKNGDGQENAE